MITLKKIKNYYNWGGRFLTDQYHIEGNTLNKLEALKTPSRSEVINFVLNSYQRKTTYLEIGVFNPEVNFNKINADIKYSVDPGVEFALNPVDFKVTSDVFFEKLRSGQYLNSLIKFDVIFIDGLHLADQVDRDIKNALEFIKDDGYILLHDCNPPTEWHARETYKYEISPARKYWNGTTWKGFMKWRNNPDLYSCTIDSDWGIGVISRHKNIGENCTLKNDFFEFNIFNTNRNEFLNLIPFTKFKELF